MTDQVGVAPGWFPDPGSAVQMRYWDGIAWTEHVHRFGAPGRPVGRGFARLGKAVEIGLRVIVLILVVEVGFYAWGLSMFSDAVASGDIDRLSTFDDIDLGFTLVEVVAELVVGIAWLVWQHRVASVAWTGELKRSPGLHVGSWFIPLGNFVMPFQNVKDLWTKFVSPRTALVAWWWAALMIGNLLSLFASASSDSIASVGDLQGTYSLWLVGSTCAIVAAVLARRIVRGLTVAAVARSAADSATLSAEAIPAG